MARGHHHQHRRAESLAQNVEQRAAHCRIGAEHAQLGRRTRRQLPVRRIVQRHQRRAGHGAQQLRRPHAQQLRIVAAVHRDGQRDGRIEICAGAAEGLRHQHAAKHRQRPPCGDHHPSRVGRIGLAQRNAGIDAVAQQHQNQRAHKLAEPNRMHRGFLTIADSRTANSIGTQIAILK